MARLNKASCSDEEFPELSTILHSVNRSPMKATGSTIQKEQGSKSTACGKISGSPFKDQLSYDRIFKNPKSATEVSSDEEQPRKQPRKQRPLRLAHVNSLLLSTTKETGHKGHDTIQYSNVNQVDFQQSTPKSTRKLLNRNKFASTLNNKFVPEDVSSDGLSDFIVSDSTSDEEDVRVRVRLRTPKAFVQQPRNENSLTGGRLHPKILQPTIIDLSSPKKATSTLTSTDSLSKKQISNQELDLSGNLFENKPQACLRM